MTSYVEDAEKIATNLAEINNAVSKFEKTTQMIDEEK